MEKTVLMLIFKAVALECASHVPHLSSTTLETLETLSRSPAQGQGAHSVWPHGSRLPAYTPQVAFIFIPILSLLSLIFSLFLPFDQLHFPLVKEIDLVSGSTEIC